jgi:putative phage-type endonuclease
MKEERSQEWIEQRKKGIGGSDAGTIMGVNPYKTALELWQEKTGRAATVQKTMNPDMKRGFYLEDIVSKLYSDITGNKLRQAKEFLALKDHPEIYANIDRKLTGEETIWECKCPRVSSFLKIKREQKIPQTYLAQCQHYSMVRGGSQIILSVFSAELWDLINFTVEPDSEFQEILLKAELHFWKHVTEDIQPEIEVDLPLAEPEEKIEGTVYKLPISSPDVEVFQNLQRAKDYKTEAEELYDMAKDAAIETMKGKNTGCLEIEKFGRFHLTKTKGRNSFDLARLTKEHPEIDILKYNKVGTPGETFKPYFFNREI